MSDRNDPTNVGAEQTVEVEIEDLQEGNAAYSVATHTTQSCFTS